MLRSAARTAADRGAPTAPSPCLRRALDEPPTGRDRVDVLIELGRIETRSTAHAAIAHLTEAYAACNGSRASARGSRWSSPGTQAFAGAAGRRHRVRAEAAAALPPES